MDASQLTLWKLEIFCQVIEEGSFSRAARSLHVSQPTVSGHVADLERMFGTRLFDRNGGQIEPTAAGRLLYRQGEKLALLKQETLDLMRNHLGLVEGELVLGGSTIPGTYILPAYLARFRRRHPEILVSMRIGDSREVVEGVLSGKLELGVVGSQVADPALVCDPFVADELVVILPLEHPLAGREAVEPAALRGQPFLARERGSGTRQITELALEQGGGIRFDELQLVCELGSSEAIKESVRQGLGLSIISIHAVRREEEFGLLHVRPLAGVDLRRSFHIVRRQGRTLSPTARVLLELLRSPKE